MDKYSLAGFAEYGRLVFRDTLGRVLKIQVVKILSLWAENKGVVKNDTARNVSVVAAHTSES